MNGHELIEQAVRNMYREFREQESQSEAMFDALNEAKEILDLVALDLGFTPDVREFPESAIDTEYVTVDEFERRPEPLWFSLAKTLAHEELTDAETLEEVRRYRQTVWRQGGMLPPRRPRAQDADR